MLLHVHTNSLQSHTASSHNHHQQQQDLSAQHASSRKLLFSQVGTSGWEYHSDAPGAAAAFGSLLGEADDAPVATASGRSKSKLHGKSTAALGLTEADFAAMEAEEAVAKKKREAEADKFSVVRFLGIKSADEAAAEAKDEGLQWLSKQQIKAKPKVKSYYYDASNKVSSSDKHTHSKHGTTAAAAGSSGRHMRSVDDSGAVSSASRTKRSASAFSRRLGSRSADSIISKGEEQAISSSDVTASPMSTNANLRLSKSATGSSSSKPQQPRQPIAGKTAGKTASEHQQHGPTKAVPGRPGGASRAPAAPTKAQLSSGQYTQRLSSLVGQDGWRVVRLESEQDAKYLVADVKKFRQAHNQPVYVMLWAPTS